MKKALILAVMLVLLASVAYATSINLGWTAVADDGNDAASGPATRYDLRYSDAPITEANFNSATQVTTVAPKAPGTAENYTFTVPDGNKHFYFAIKVYDEQDNASPLSNLAEADLFTPAAVVDLKSHR